MIFQELLSVFIGWICRNSQEVVNYHGFIKVISKTVKTHNNIKTNLHFFFSPKAIFIEVTLLCFMISSFSEQLFHYAIKLKHILD